MELLSAEHEFVKSLFAQILGNSLGILLGFLSLSADEHGWIYSADLVSWR